MQKTVFVVDDNATNLAFARDALKDHYQVMTMPSAAKMFMMLKKITPDLILLDINMPEMNGFEALERLKENPAQKDIPVIFLTGLEDEATEVKGFQEGVIDFIRKPSTAPILQNRLKTHLNIDKLIRERTKQLNTLKDSIVFVLADMVERRDQVTYGHIERTTMFVELLVKKMLELEVYYPQLHLMDMQSLATAARLHDVGKIIVPDYILNKPGKLTDDEFEIIKTHAAEGEKIIEEIVSRTGTDEEFLTNAKFFAGYHHERWDGKGYPHGLAGEDIPLQGRIMAFADVYDALVSERPYKKAFTHEQAEDIIKECVGTQFDPNIAEAFFAITDDFKRIAENRELG